MKKTIALLLCVAMMLSILPMAVFAEGNTGEIVLPPDCFHSYIYTDNEDGETHTVTCNYCGGTYSEAHTFVEGVCVCGAAEAPAAPVYDSTLKFNGHNLFLDSSLGVNWGITASIVDNAKDVYVVITKADGILQQNQSLTVHKNDFTFSGSKYYAMFPTVASCEMGDTLIATLYVVDADGTVRYSAPDEYSVLTYANAAMNSYINTATSNPNSKQYLGMRLMVALLNYGAAAQTFFSYKTDALVNKDLTPAQLAFAPADSTFTNYRDYGANNGEVIFNGTSLNLQEKINSEIKISVAGLTSCTKDDLTAVVVNTETSEVIQTIEGKDFVPTGANFYIDVTVLNTTQLRTKVEITVYKDYGEATQAAVSSTATYSVESYVAVANAAGATGRSAIIGRAVLNYGDAAAAYFAFK